MSYITTEKIVDTSVFHVRLPGGARTNPTLDYDTARGWAHQPGSQVVLTRTQMFVCEDAEDD